MSKIIGAGLAGLIAAHIFPRHGVIEVGERPQEGHMALLRFRTQDVSRVTGIDFKKVVVRKGIFANDTFVEPTIALANAYSMKCLRRTLGERSIWNLDPVERFIAPPDFYWQMVNNLGSRIEWATQYDFSSAAKEEAPVISTAPMPVVLRSVGLHTDEVFNSSPIVVRRYVLDACDVYQTVYFPGSDISLYRASITGNLLICEFVGEPSGDWQRQVYGAFGISPVRWALTGNSSQRYGKIAPIDEGVRKATICNLTLEHNILSLGRFACWRNILLDDVVQDATTVKRLAALSTYDRRMIAARGAQQ